MVDKYFRVVTLGYGKSIRSPLLWLDAGNCCLLGYCCCCCCCYCWKGLVNPSTLLFQPFFLFLTFLYTRLRTLTFFPREGSIITLYFRSLIFLLVCPSRSRLYLRAGVTCHSFYFILFISDATQETNCKDFSLLFLRPYCLY